MWAKMTRRFGSRVLQPRQQMALVLWRRFLAQPPPFAPAANRLMQLAPIAVSVLAVCALVLCAVAAQSRVNHGVDPLTHCVSE